MSNQITPTHTPLPLAQLHLPPEPEIFPLAWGWWLIIAICLFSILFLIYQANRAIKRRAAKKAALKELAQCHSLAQINSLLKRAALSYFPRHEVASLTTVKWLHFLDEQLKPSERGFVSMQNQWINGSFSANSGNIQTVAQAKAIASIWLKKALPAKKKNLKKEQEHV